MRTPYRITSLPCVRLCPFTSASYPNRIRASRPIHQLTAHHVERDLRREELEGLPVEKQPVPLHLGAISQSPQSRLWQSPVQCTPELLRTSHCLDTVPVRRDDDPAPKHAPAGPRTRRPLGKDDHDNPIALDTANAKSLRKVFPA